MLTDRDEFAAGSAILGVAMAVLASATATGWGVAVLATTIPLMALLATRFAPPGWLALVWAGTATVVTEASGTGDTGYFVIVVLLTVLAAKGMSRVETVLAIALVLSPLVMWIARVEDYLDFGPWTWMAGIGLGWLFGSVINRQWQLIDELEATRQQLAEAAVDDERQRIAREMHDVVGHSFSVVLLHLAGARTILDRDPDSATDALRRAEDVGRRGMEDLRQTLGLMRSGDDAMRPVPDARALAELIDDYRDAGLAITTELDPTFDDVVGASRIVAHDVIREALTNCAKHAPGAAVSTNVEVSRACIDVTVENDMPGSTTVADDGSGIAGLRHRVEALCGRLDAGTVDGRFVLHATIPRDVDAATATDRIDTVDRMSTT